MIENRPLLKLTAHLVLIAGVALVAFPVYLAIIASTHGPNDFMSGVMLAVGIKLVDFKIEIGRIFEGDYQRLIVADEISPDSCRLWDAHTNEKLDKDRFRRDLGNVTEAYAEVARRLGIMKENGSVTEEGSPE